ncbi:hypothetical protein DB347_17785 [Opitutaceae bacterium EW11]|nr:hypothetical protein DB347_17785 [Opitutaceae bacterium EW11]
MAEFEILLATEEPQLSEAHLAAMEAADRWPKQRIARAVQLPAIPEEELRQALRQHGTWDAAVAMLLNQ